MFSSYIHILIKYHMTNQTNTKNKCGLIKRTVQLFTSRQSKKQLENREINENQMLIIVVNLCLLQIT